MIARIQGGFASAPWHYQIPDNNVEFSSGAAQKTAGIVDSDLGSSRIDDIEICFAEIVSGGHHDLRHQFYARDPFDRMQQSCSSGDARPKTDKGNSLRSGME